VESLWLAITKGPDAGRRFPVSGSVSIGRDASAGIVIDDEQVSRRHAVVSLEDGGLVVHDLESTNGTWVNGERVVARQALAVGDRLQIGATVIELRTSEVSVRG
jgi:pSer/pThr/pTyr-binding forkhead associated (FHA) protein